MKLSRCCMIQRLGRTAGAPAGQPPHAHSVAAPRLALWGPSCICSCMAVWFVPTLPVVHLEKLQLAVLAVTERAEKGWDEWMARKSSQRNHWSYWTLTVSLSPSEPLLESPCREEYTQLWSSWFCWQRISQQGAAESKTGERSALQF